MKKNKYINIDYDNEEVKKEVAFLIENADSIIAGIAIDAQAKMMVVKQLIPALKEKKSFALRLDEVIEKYTKYIEDGKRFLETQEKVEK